MSANEHLLCMVQGLDWVYYFIHSVLRRVGTQAIVEFQVDYVACAV